MDNQEQRDIAEETYNRRTCPECDGQHEPDEACFPDKYPLLHETDGLPDYNEESNVGTSRSYREWIGNAGISDVSSDPNLYDDWKKLGGWNETPLPVGYGDSWDGSSRGQTNDFFIGHSGHVTILWHVTNNPYEKYDSSISYQLPASDGSALYVWCNLKFTDAAAIGHIREFERLMYEIAAPSRTYHL